MLTLESYCLPSQVFCVSVFVAIPLGKQVLIFHLKACSWKDASVSQWTACIFSGNQNYELWGARELRTVFVGREHQSAVLYLPDHQQGTRMACWFPCSQPKPSLYQGKPIA